MDKTVVEVSEFFKLIVDKWKEKNPSIIKNSEVYTFFPYIHENFFIFPISVIKDGNLVYFKWIKYDVSSNEIFESEQYYDKYINFEQIYLFDLAAFSDENGKFSDLLKTVRELSKTASSDSSYNEKQKILIVKEERYIKSIAEIKKSDKFNKMYHKGGIDSRELKLLNIEVKPFVKDQPKVEVALMDVKNPKVTSNEVAESTTSSKVTEKTIINKQSTDASKTLDKNTNSKVKDKEENVVRNNNQKQATTKADNKNIKQNKSSKESNNNFDALVANIQNSIKDMTNKSASVEKEEKVDDKKQIEIDDTTAHSNEQPKKQEDKQLKLSVKSTIINNCAVVITGFQNDMEKLFKNNPILKRFFNNK